MLGYRIFSFNVCLTHAVREGIPSFCSEHSPAAPVSLLLNQLDKIENPIRPDREKMDGYIIRFTIYII